MIETTVDKKNDLTIYKCSGNMTEEEIINLIHSLYNSNLTLNTLWDCSGASVKDISTSFVRQIARELCAWGTLRQGGKTAVVAPEELIFGLSRVFQIMTGEKGFPFKVDIFKSHDEARKWLLEKE